MQYKSRLIAVERNHFASVLVAAERGTPPPARAVASLDSSSSSSLLDLVVVVLLLDLVLLLSFLRPRSFSMGLGQWLGARAGELTYLEILRRGSTLALASSKLFGVSAAPDFVV